MLQTDVSKLLDGMHYLIENEQYDALFTQLQFAVTLLLEQQHIEEVIALFDQAIPILLTEHKVSIVRELVELVMPHVQPDDAYLYGKMLFFSGHVYFLIEETDQSIHYYRQSLGYFMKCEPVPFQTIAITLLNLAALTEKTTTYETQLSYARIISVFKSINTTDETAKDIVNKYSFYYETCLRLERFDDAYAILLKLKQLTCPPQSREQLQVQGAEVMYYYKTKQYDIALQLVTHVLAQFPKHQNITIMLLMYNVAIDCSNKLQHVPEAMQLQKERDALQKHLQMQRMELNEKFPLPTNTLPDSTSLQLMSQYVNDALAQGTCYTVIVYDVSLFEEGEQTTMLKQLHTAMQQTFSQPIVYFTAINRHQSVYVVPCGEAHTWARIEKVLSTLPFSPTYGYCHSSKAAIPTFEQLLHMSYAYIYYAHSQKRKVT